jgi:hypothetical protein
LNGWTVARVLTFARPRPAGPTLKGKNMPKQSRSAKPKSDNDALKRILLDEAAKHVEEVATELGKNERRKVTPPEAEAIAQLITAKEWCACFSFARDAVDMMESALLSILAIHEIDPASPPDPETTYESATMALEALIALQSASRYAISENPQRGEFAAQDGFRLGSSIQCIESMLNWHSSMMFHKVHQGASEGGKAKSKADSKWQDEIVNIMAKNPHVSYTEACRRVANKSDVCLKTVTRNTKHPAK